MRGILLKGVLAALAVVSLVSGCTDSGPSTRIFVRKAEGQRIRIAVLPFDNVSRDQDAGRVVTSTVITYLLSTGEYDVVEPGVVYSALASEGIRATEGITQEACQKLRAKLNADAFIVGLVQNYGEVRIGPDTYPSISFSARVVDAQHADILWAATISKTGAEHVQIFDIGRVSSIGKLANIAVKDMADSLSRSRLTIWPATIAKSNQPVPKPGATIITEGTQAGTHGTVAIERAAETTPSQSTKATDENAVYGEKELTALLKDVGTAKLGTITYKKHYHDSIETQYSFGDTGKFADVKLVDYKKVVVAEKFIQYQHPGEQEEKFQTYPAFKSESEFGYYHLDVAIGRFALFIRGPKTMKSDIEALATGLIDSVK